VQRSTLISSRSSADHRTTITRLFPASSSITLKAAWARNSSPCAGRWCKTRCVVVPKRLAVKVTISPLCFCREVACCRNRHYPCPARSRFPCSPPCPPSSNGFCGPTSRVCRSFVIFASGKQGTAPNCCCFNERNSSGPCVVATALEQHTAPSALFSTRAKLAGGDRIPRQGCQAGDSMRQTSTSRLHMTQGLGVRPALYILREIMETLLLKTSARTIR